MSDDRLDDFRAIIVALQPGLAAAPCRLIDSGWDSVAVDVDDRFIFKFPRDEESEEQLVVEARLLDLIRRHVAMPVPTLEIFETPRLFSRHAKLRGDHLLPDHYAALSEAQRDRLAGEMARFYAELHAIPTEDAERAGAEPGDGWPDTAEIRAGILPYLDADLLAVADRTLDAYAALPADPHGDVFGFFDGHGMNMAFDHAAGRLNGIYDFGDAEIAPLHQEFIHGSITAPDLTARTITAYEAITGRAICRRTVDLHEGMMRLTELAEDGEGHMYSPMIREATTRWLAARR